MNPSLFAKRRVLLLLFWTISFHCVVGQQAPDDVRDRLKMLDNKHYFLKPGDIVLFLGNSITEQAELELEYLRMDIRRHYPELMEGDDQVKFVLAGIGGEQAFEGLKRLPDLLRQHKPTVCVVNYGTCEITFDNENSYVPAMRSIIEKLRAGNVATTIVTNPPCSINNWKSKKSSIPKFVKMLPVMAKKAKSIARKESLFLADAYKLLNKHQKKGGEELTVDGIHLNKLGYRLMADALQEAWGYGCPLAGISRLSVGPSTRVVGGAGSRGLCNLS